MTTPEPPSKNKQWTDSKLEAWRRDAEGLRVALLAGPHPGAIKHNDAWVTDYLKSYEIPAITEELVLLMWVTVPLLASFLDSRLQVTCPDPTARYNIMRYLSDGLDFAGVELLELEKRIGERLT